MRVIATARGWDNLAMREEGDIFEMPDNIAFHGPKKPTWFEPYEDEETRRRRRATAGVGKKPAPGAAPPLVSRNNDHEALHEAHIKRQTPDTGSLV